MSTRPVAVPEATPRGTPVLELRNVSKHFGGVAACDGVGLVVNAGQIVAVVGHNGAGKSTVLRMVSGVMQPDTGELLVIGKPARLRSVHDARARGIETVPQELALAPKLNVYMNVYLGRELLMGPPPLRFLNRRRMEHGARALLESIGVQVPNMRSKVGGLSGGQRQGVAIARALGWGRSIVVLDEPTAALGVHETEQVEKSLMQMKELGLGLLLVSHDLDQVFRVADHIYVLYHGRVVGDMDRHDTSRDEVVALITGVAMADNSQTGARP